MVNTYLQPKSNSKILTKKQQKFLDSLIETDGNPKEAAKLAGYSTGSHYQVVKALKNEIIDLASDVLANSAPEAAFKLVDIMKTDRPIPQISNKLQAAQTILDRVGVTKKERLEVNHNNTGGVFILPAKNIIDVEPSSSASASPSELLQDELEPITDWESEGGS